MATKTKTEIIRHSFFANTEKPTGIIIPEVPVFVQANCSQSGSWILGEKNLGNENLQFFVLVFLFGQELNPYKDIEISTGTIFFTPIDTTTLKPQLVYATKIKNQASGRKGSLANFGARVAECVASGTDPREVIWTAKFVNKSGSLPDGKLYNCAVIDFTYRTIQDEEESNLLNNCVLVLEDDTKLNKLQLSTLPKFAELEAA